ncbi:hypothetical protein ISG33_15755 [Glaciecola sp. MH2013]|uniref:hypothetical protein n=1 Tax=Glaciecola sp. MH2013 TaxID=2785524 RepID=UPI00189E5263|nr:hypothetical protein [Glaciecola sp. MH2013]MBF7074857.1 hypothetical protein [Glaciecola sp. MH2013]
MNSKTVTSIVLPVIFLTIIVSIFLKLSEVLLIELGINSFLIDVFDVAVIATVFIIFYQWRLK